MGDSRLSIPEDVEIGLVGTCSKKNIKWLQEKLKEPAENLKKKGNNLIENLYGHTSHGHTIFKYECKANGRGPLEPRVVAIGPYHRNCKNRLKFDDDFKLEITRFMVNYCRLDANKYLGEMEEKEEDVRSCYDKDLRKWSSEEFRTMLLLDSFFILFVMDGFCIRELERIGPYAEYKALYVDVMEHSEQIKVDLLTVDNQIPFFTIEMLRGCFPQGSVYFTKSIEELALSCFDNLWPVKNKKQVLEQKNKQRTRFWKKNNEQQFSRRSVPFLQDEVAPAFTGEPETSKGEPYDKFHHLLHLFHWSRIPEKGYEMDREDRNSRNASQLYIPSATELQKSATKFKKKDSGSCLDVTFNRRATSVSGVVNIPVLKLYDYSKPIFRNLIAFEATPTSSVLSFTAYMACMSCILQRDDDVKLLRERGIVASTNYKDSDVVHFFAELNEEIEDVEMPDTLRILYTSVTNHHDSRISKCWGNFMLQYCPNFWVALSLVAAIVLFANSLLQTIYGMLTYYVPDKK